MSVRFTEDVAVAQGDLVARGVAVADYPVTAFTYDGSTFTATWTLGKSLGPLSATPSGDRVTLHLSNVVKDLDEGNRLDGDWANDGAGPDTFPSGDDVADGMFQFVIKILPGDADRSGRVNSIDKASVHQKLNTTAQGGGTYEPYNDLDGSNRINSLDEAAVQQRLNSVVPEGEPDPFLLPDRTSGITLTSGQSKIDLSWQAGDDVRS